jgi:hypothetical protein
MTKVEFLFYYRHGGRVKRRRREYADRAIRVRVENENGVRFRDVLETFIAHAGDGLREVPRTQYRISLDASRLWMLGAVFATEEEVAMVERPSK